MTKDEQLRVLQIDYEKLKVKHNNALRELDRLQGVEEENNELKARLHSLKLSYYGK